MQEDLFSSSDNEDRQQTYNKNIPANAYPRNIVEAITSVYWMPKTIPDTQQLVKLQKQRVPFL